MTRYKVTLYYHSYATVTVNAKNEQDAVETARCHVTNEDINDNLIEDGSPDVEKACDDDEAVNKSPLETLADTVRRHGAARPNGSVIFFGDTVRAADRNIELVRVMNDGRILATIVDDNYGNPFEDTVTDDEATVLNGEIIRRATSDGNDGTEERQPLFSEEDIEGMHVGDNNMHIGMMHVEDEADLEKAKAYLRELNRKHLAEEPLTENDAAAIRTEAKGALTELIMEYGNRKRAGFRAVLKTFQLCSDYGLELDGSTVDELRLHDNGDIDIVYNENTDDVQSANDIDARKLSNFTGELTEALIAQAIDETEEEAIRENETVIG